MNPKFYYMVEDVQGLSEAISEVAEELKDGGELSGDDGKEFMKQSVFEVLHLQQCCTAVLKTFMTKYAKDFAELRLQYPPLSLNLN